MSTTKKGRTLKDFRAAHDRNVIVPQRLKEVLARLEKEQGPEHYEYELDLGKLAGVGMQDINVFREQFQDHVVTVRVKGNERRVWFATAKAAALARNFAE
jgi:hypothetical protein